MRLKHLPNVHARWHTQRIQNQINRRTIFQEWHVFFGDDLGHNTLVTMASGHLVTDRQLPLGSDEHAYRFNDTGINFVPGRHAVRLLLMLGLQVIETLGEATDDFQNLVFDRRRIDRDLVVNLREFTQQRLGDFPISRNNHFIRLGVGDV